MAVCGVCSKELEKGEVVFRCMKCYSLHHPDCWGYNGKCAAYGCGSEAGDFQKEDYAGVVAKQIEIKEEANLPIVRDGNLPALANGGDIIDAFNSYRKDVFILETDDDVTFYRFCKRNRLPPELIPLLRKVLEKESGYSSREVDTACRIAEQKAPVDITDACWFNLAVFCAVAGVFYGIGNFFFDAALIFVLLAMVGLLGNFCYSRVCRGNARLALRVAWRNDILNNPEHYAEAYPELKSLLEDRRYMRMMYAEEIEKIMEGNPAKAKERTNAH